MKYALPLAIGVLLALPLCAQAQQSRQQADPADPGVAVPPVVYEPAIAPALPPAQAGLTPDQAWRAANEAVAGTGAHAGHGAAAAPAASQAHEGHGATPAPATPAQPPAAGHGKHPDPKVQP